MSRRNSRVIDTQLKQIDAIFRAHSADPPVIKLLEVKKDKNCDIHGVCTSRRGSTDSTKNLSRKGSNASNGGTNGELKSTPYCSTDRLNENFRKKNRNSIASFTELVERSVTPNGLGIKREALDREMLNRPRRESMPIIDNTKRPVGKKNSSDTWNSKLFKGMEHPSKFPNMLRSSTQSLNGKDTVDYHSPKSSSSWNVNHFHNYNGKANGTNLDKKQSMSISDKIFKRDYANGGASSTGSSPEPKKELHSILKHKKHDEDDLKEIIKRLSFDYIEKEMSQNGAKMDIDLLSNSDSSSGGGAGRRTPVTFKVDSRRMSIDSLDSSRRVSRRLSDFSSVDDEADDDVVTLKNRLNRSSTLVSTFRSTLNVKLNCASEKHSEKLSTQLHHLMCQRMTRPNPQIAPIWDCRIPDRVQYDFPKMCIARPPKLSWEKHRSSLLAEKKFAPRTKRSRTKCFFVSRSKAPYLAQSADI